MYGMQELTIELKERTLQVQELEKKAIEGKNQKVTNFDIQIAVNTIISSILSNFHILQEPRKWRT